MICAQNAFQLLSLDKQEERMPDTLFEMSLVGIYDIHLTECIFRSVNWIDEDEEHCHDGRMRFVSIALASASRPIVRSRTT